MTNKTTIRQSDKVTQTIIQAVIQRLSYYVFRSPIYLRRLGKVLKTCVVNVYCYGLYIFYFKDNRPVKGLRNIIQKDVLIIKGSIYDT